MIVDTSAIIAILLGEPESDRLTRALDADPVRWMSAATRVEVGIVAMVKRAGGEHDVERLLQEAAIEIVAVTSEHAKIALDAYARFGKGRHAAGLNFGDCFSYALAHATGQPLLFVGEDFARTDVRVA